MTRAHRRPTFADLARPSLPSRLVAYALVASSLGGCGGAMAMEAASTEAAAPTRAEPQGGAFLGGYPKMAPDMPMDLAAPPPPPPPPPPGAPEPMPILPPGQQPSGPAARAGAGAERPDAVIIYTAELTLAVFEVQKSIEQVAAIAKSQGGFLARRDDQSITVRVPSSHFDQTVKELEAVGDVLHRNVTAEDVSEEFHDLQIQLRNLMAMRERLVALLAKSTKVEEAIAVEKELGRVAGEIDRIQGRLKFLEDRAQMSTITVMLQPRAPSTVEKGPFQVPLRWIGDLGIDRLIHL